MLTDIQVISCVALLYHYDTKATLTLRCADACTRCCTRCCAHACNDMHILKHVFGFAARQIADAKKPRVLSDAGLVEWR